MLKITNREQLLTSRIEELRGEISDFSRSPRRLDPLVFAI